jgi:RHS repeat-associated protein
MADTLTSSSYYRARYYSPVLERFVSEDSNGLAGGSTNFYEYTFNDPTSQVDPSGLATVTNNTGAPILASGNAGFGHGTGDQVYGVIPPDGKLYGGVDNPMLGYATPQEALDAYFGNGPSAKPIGNIYDIDFYSPTPLTRNSRLGKQSCSRKVIGDEKGPHYTLKENGQGQIVDSYPPYQWPSAVLRRISEMSPWWLRYLPDPLL